MSDSKVEAKQKIDPNVVFREKVISIAATASEADKSLVKEIMNLARSKERAAPLFSLSPPVCALLFLNSNGHNRDFVLSHAQELARRMETGLWKPNNATIGFYDDGEIGDGQHRLAAAVLANFRLTDYILVFGMSHNAIDTVDSPKARDGASHAKLDGLKETSAKQSIVKDFAAYMVRTGDPSFALRSASEIKRAIEDNDHELDACLRIGAESVKKRPNPVLKSNRAASVAYLMLKNGWQEQKIREMLDQFQSGESRDSDSAPFFVAGNLIVKARTAKEAKNRLTGVRELGVVVYAMVQTERGIKATKDVTIKNIVKEKIMPSPHYPISDSQQEQAA